MGSGADVSKDPDMDGKSYISSFGKINTGKKVYPGGPGIVTSVYMRGCIGSLAD